MDITDPKQCDALDLRPVWRARYPSYGPDWDAAIEAGVDVGELEENLKLTPTERLEQLDRLIKNYELLRSAAPRDP